MCRAQSGNGVGAVRALLEYRHPSVQDRPPRTFRGIECVDLNLRVDEDAAGMKDQVAQMKQLSKQIQDAILKNSDDAFNELKEEEAKGKQ